MNYVFEKKVCLVKEYIIYTDGSYRLPNVGAYGGIILDKADGSIVLDFMEVCVGDEVTNNSMELLAIQKALESIPEKSKVHIFSDSKYAIFATSLWYKKWMRNDWLTMNGAPVSNRKIIEDIVRLSDMHPVYTIEHVYGHSGDTYNDHVDIRVRTATRDKVIALYGATALQKRHHFKK